MEIIPNNCSLNEKEKDSEWYAWILLFYITPVRLPKVAFVGGVFARHSLILIKQ